MDRKRLKNSITAYMFNRDIDIDERLSRFFIYIGIVAAFLGVIINAAAGASALGIIATLVIAIGAPSLLGVTVILNKSEKYGQFIAIGLSFIMPFVWIGSGAAAAESMSGLSMSFSSSPFLPPKRSFPSIWLLAVLLRSPALFWRPSAPIWSIIFRIRRGSISA